MKDAVCLTFILILLGMLAYNMLVISMLEKQLRGLRRKSNRLRIVVNALHATILHRFQWEETYLMDSSFDDLRNRFLAIQVDVTGGTRSENAIGGGRRVVFLVRSNGQQALVLDIMGREKKLSTCELTVTAAYAADGKLLEFNINKRGHLIIETEDEALDYGPWTVYDPTIKLEYDEVEEQGEVDEILL